MDVMDDQLICDWQGMPTKINRRRGCSGPFWVSFSNSTSFSWLGTLFTSIMHGEQRSKAGDWWGY